MLIPINQNALNTMICFSLNPNAVIVWNNGMPCYEEYYLSCSGEALILAVESRRNVSASPIVPERYEMIQEWIDGN